MKRLGIISAASISVVMLATSAFAQDFQKGLDAANSGDYATALQEWRPLAEQGDADAQFNLGLMYRKGAGVPQDYSEAVKLYRLAAEQGVADAQTNLGVRYQNGQGVPQDYTEAAKWYRMAAEQGYATAQSNLGSLYANGKGVPQDYVLAHMWYNLGSANGNEVGAENRDIVARKMILKDISKAQTMAKECISSNYQKCGY